MDKGDFIGRSALVDKDRSGLLYGLICHTETPSSGSIIVDSDREIGKITAGVPSPTLGCGIGVPFRSVRSERDDWFPYDPVRVVNADP